MALSGKYDVVILGGGAAGLLCAFTAGQRGRRVLVLEVSNKLGKKILMSGGGRCNFTNLDVTAEHFICPNPHFVKSALSRYSQWDFISLVVKHEVAYHDKGHGQLFCDGSAKDILQILTTECQAAGVEIKLNCAVSEVVVETRHDGAYTVVSSLGKFSCDSLVVATGGLSIPTLGGATGLGYRLADQFGLSVNPTEASLVPLTLTGQLHEFVQSLAGVSTPVTASVPSKGFTESMLFTHRGISGPAILQLSNYWSAGETISIGLLPSVDGEKLLLSSKQEKPSATVSQVLSQLLPKSLIAALQPDWWRDCTMHEFKDAELIALAERLHRWQIKPAGTEGYRTAEVTRGGVDVSRISSKTMEVVGHPGLYFIGEVLDVTGHLGGFNFQWAWSSGYVAGSNA